MHKVTSKFIIDSAKAINNKKLGWHFHILTPECVFNDKNMFALVLENTSGNEVLVNYSEDKQEREGKILLELLHGIKADKLQVSTVKVSPKVKEMEKRANELINKGVNWHHHALFPNCTFNKNKGKWVLMLEDPETKQVIENVTDYKPEADLQVIEPLFYHQKK
jgi:hypothetical protein